MNVYYVTAIWLGMALLAAVVSIRVAVPAALVEIVIGALAGNIPGLREHVTQTGVVVFLASAGSLIDQDQYTELVTVVILSAFVPTLIAQQFFRPGLAGSRGASRKRAGLAPAPRWRTRRRRWTGDKPDHRHPG